MTKSMTVSELRDQLDTLPDGERADYAKVLVKHLSKPALFMLELFQTGWFMTHHGEEPTHEEYKKFVAEQNKVLRACIATDMKPIGAALQTIAGREPLTGDTILTLDSNERTKDDDTKQTASDSPDMSQLSNS